MHGFADKCGRTWSVDVTPRTLRGIREATDLDLFDPAADPIGRISKDPVLLAAVLWAAVRDQAASAGVSEADFLDGLDMLAVTRGRRAVCLAMCDFFSLDGLREEATAANVVGYVVQTILKSDLALGNGTPLGIGEVPPPDDLRARLLDLMATLRGADAWQADALFEDIEAVERRILAHRQAWRRRQWKQGAGAAMSP